MVYKLAKRGLADMSMTSDHVGFTTPRNFQHDGAGTTDEPDLSETAHNAPPMAFGSR